MTSLFHPPNYLWILILNIVSDAGQLCTNNDFYVSSNGTNNSDCLSPGNQSNPCATLTYLVNGTRNKTNCLTIEVMSDLTLSNSVLQFIGGNVSLTASKNTPVIIYCEGNSGIVLESVSNFFLKHIQFIRCSFNVSQFQCCSFDNSGDRSSSKDGSSDYASVLIKSSINVYIFECSFKDHHGSSILFVNVSQVVVENSNFTGSESLLNNEHRRSGGISWRLGNLKNSASCIVTISSCIFTSNINLKDSDKHFKDRSSRYDECSLFGMQCYSYGGAIEIITSVVDYQSPLHVYIENCYFQDNVATFGGAISVATMQMVFVSIKNCTFDSNVAYSEGGAVRIFQINSQKDPIWNVTLTNSMFNNNCAYWGGAVSAIGDTFCNNSIIFSNTTFTSNIANHSGFAIALSGPFLAISCRNNLFDGDDDFIIQAIFEGYTYILNNTGNEYGALASIDSHMTFNSPAYISGNTQSGMFLRDSKVLFNNQINFTNNAGTSGAAIYVDGGSLISFGPMSNGYFHNNIVSLLGGAIYSSVTNDCTFEISAKATKHVIFYGNHANLLVQSIYIASSDHNCNQISTKRFKFIPHVETQVLFPLDTLIIDFKPDIKKVMLGEKFVLKPTKLLDVFSHYSVGIGYIRFQVKNNSIYNDAYLLRGPSTISLDNYTGNLEFFVVGPEITKDEEAEINVYYSKEHGSYEDHTKKINFTLVPCKIGYEHKRVECDCESNSSTNNFFQCDPHGQMLCVRKHYWYSKKFQTTYLCPAQNCWFMNNKCPNRTEECDHSTKYCGIKEEDDVCWNGKSKFLCSLCADNHSFTFSAFKCTSSESCHLWNTFSLLFALLVYWILFIFVLLLGLSLNLSTGSGFMIGIVYYFSVAIIYTRSENFSDMWLRILLYLDMAIALCDPELLGYITNVCFAESWKNPLSHELFRYATPLFLMLALVLLTLFCRYCRMPKFLSLAENSPIHAMCLLILLSYTSISCTSLKLLVPMRVNGSLRVQAAPNVSYFSREHIPYAVVGICAELFFCLPICVLFLFAPLISRRVNLVKLRLKPIVDEFQACYKMKYRWYAGFYFLSRQIIYLVNMTLSGPFPQSNYVLTTINIMVLLIHVLIRPYLKKWLNILDTILLTDIVVLSLLSPVRDEAISKVSLFHNVLIPSSLLLFPSIYLFTAIGLILVRKLCGICCQSKVCSNLRKGHLNSFIQWILKHKFTSKELQNFGSDHSLEDPLLAFNGDRNI